MKVVFDSNVFISAFLFGGTSLEAIEHSINARHELFISAFILSEFSDKLKTKFRVGADEIARDVDLNRINFSNRNSNQSNSIGEQR